MLPPRPSMQPVVTGDMALDEASRLIALAARIHARVMAWISQLPRGGVALPALQHAMSELESAALLIDDAKSLLLERETDASLVLAGSLQVAEAALSETRLMLEMHVMELKGRSSVSG